MEAVELMGTAEAADAKVCDDVRGRDVAPDEVGIDVANFHGKWGQVLFTRFIWVRRYS